MWKVVARRTTRITMTLYLVKMPHTVSRQSLGSGNQKWEVLGHPSSFGQHDLNRNRNFYMANRSLLHELIKKIHHKFIRRGGEQFLN